MNLLKCAPMLLAPLFSLSMIGAKGCFDDLGNAWSSSRSPPPQKPYCLTDPPYGCAAICLGPGMPAFTERCADISAGPLTVQFQDTVEALATMAEAAGKPVCAPDALAGQVTSCDVGLTPNQVESSDACMPPPPGCGL